MALVAILLSVYAAIVSFTQAFFAKDQAESAQRQARAAEETNQREADAARESEEPYFEWRPPTGNADKLEIVFKNTGGPLLMQHAEVAIAGVDIPLLLPKGKIPSGGQVRFDFTPPRTGNHYPIKLTIQYSNFQKEMRQLIVHCDHLGSSFHEI